jgi:hypothetical protein
VALGSGLVAVRAGRREKMTKYNRTGTMETTGRRTWNDYADTYRSDWETRYGTNRSWDEHGPAYRYGWEAGGDERYRGREFSDVENDLRGTT